MNEVNWLNRTSRLIGEERVELLRRSRIAVLGLGGVGGTVVEGLCRSGVGELLLIDHDTVDITNLNRQIIATHKNIGDKKVDVFKERLLSINPEIIVTVKDAFYLPDNSDFLYDFKPDFIVDAIDTITAKLHIAKQCHTLNIPLISSMGTGNRLDPSKFLVGDIADTTGCGCPVARIMRRELKKRDIEHLTVLYSTELPQKIASQEDEKRHSPASIAFVPPVAGYVIAGYVIRSLIQNESI